MTVLRRNSFKRASRELVSLVPRPWDLNVFVQRVADVRRRPINIIVAHDLSAEGGVTGFCRSEGDKDFIYVNNRASGISLITIVCHEVAHLWRGHKPEDLGFVGPNVADELEPMLSEDATRKLVNYFVLYRHDYESKAEVEAEYLATKVLAAIERRLPGSSGSLTDSLMW